MRRNKVEAKNADATLTDFEEEIKKVTDGVDHIIEFIGKSYWTQNLSVLRRDGTMVYLAFMSGPTFPENANIAPVSCTPQRLTYEPVSLISLTEMIR